MKKLVLILALALNSAAFAVGEFQCKTETPLGPLEGICRATEDGTIEIFTCDGVSQGYLKGLTITKTNTCGENYLGFNK